MAKRKLFALLFLVLIMYFYRTPPIWETTAPSRILWLRLFIFIMPLVSVLHWDAFYYSHDVLKWLVIDITLSFFIYFNRHRFSFYWTLSSSLYLASGYLMVASLLWSDHSYASIEFIARFFIWGTALIILVTSYTRKELLNLLVLSSVWSSFVFSLVFIVERWIGVPVNNGAFTPIGFTNNAGHVFNIWIPCLCYFLYQNRKDWLGVIIGLIALVIVCYVLMISNIRATVLGLLFGELIYLVILVWRNKQALCRHLKASLLLIFVLGAGYLSQSALQHQVISQVKTVTSDPLGAYSPRWNMVANSIDMVVDNPFGVGINNFEYHHPAYAKVGTDQASNFVNEKQILRTPHNFFLKMFTEIGWLGGGALSLLAIFVFFKAVKLAIGKSNVSWLIVPVFAFLFHSLLSQVFISPLSYVFAIFLFSVVVSRQEKSDETKGANAKYQPLLLLALLVPALSLAQVVSSYYSFNGIRYAGVEHLEKAVEINPGNDRAWLMLSRRYYERLEGKQQSLQAINRFLELYPEHIFGRYHKARLFVELGQCGEARGILLRLLQHYPTYDAAGYLLNRTMQCQPLPDGR